MFLKVSFGETQSVKQIGLERQVWADSRLLVLLEKMCPDGYEMTCSRVFSKVQRNVDCIYMVAKPKGKNFNMSKYGLSATDAANLLKKKCDLSPVDAWNIATKRMFPGKESAQQKGCPRGAFLGLCETGKITGVKPGNYTRSIKNKEYALRALVLLESDPQQTPISTMEADFEKDHTMDKWIVVVALFNEGVYLASSLWKYSNTLEGFFVYNLSYRKL